MKSAFFLLVLILVTTGCTDFHGMPATPGELTIGTFNIAWLGDGTNDRIQRSEYHYSKIAEIIQTLEPDVLALQEVENEAALQRIRKYLPGYTYLLSTDEDEPQKVAFLLKQGIKVIWKRMLHETEVAADTTRKGLAAHLQKGSFDFIAIAVHFKSTSRYDDTYEKKMRSYALRDRQSTALSGVIDSILAEGKEKDIVLLGDFNDSPAKKRHNLNALAENKNISFLTGDMLSCKTPIWKGIDHIVCSGNMHGYYMENSIFTYDIKSAVADKDIEFISDHCPVTASFLLPGK